MVVSKAAPDAASPTREMSEDSSVNELSRLLLQGWTMLAETCPRPNCHMPLARSRAGRVVCTHCRADVVSRVSETPAGGEASRAGSRPGFTDALGQKLLQGWTLMDDACQRCSTPLVRDDQGRVICVACEEGEGADGEAQTRVMNSDERRVVNSDARSVVNTDERRVVNSDERRVVNRENGRGETDGRVEPVPERRVEPLSERRVERVERRVEPVGERRVEPMGERRVERVERRVGEPREPSAGAEGRRTTTVARVDQQGMEIDVDGELILCEEAAARRLRGLRARLSRAEDAEACRVICAAMTEACNVIRASRQARGLPRGA